VSLHPSAESHPPFNRCTQFLFLTNSNPLPCAGVSLFPQGRRTASMAGILGSCYAFFYSFLLNFVVPSPRVDNPFSGVFLFSYTVPLSDSPRWYPCPRFRSKVLLPSFNHSYSFCVPTLFGPRLSDGLLPPESMIHFFFLLQRISVVAEEPLLVRQSLTVVPVPPPSEIMFPTR